MCVCVCVCVCICVYLRTGVEVYLHVCVRIYLPNPPHEQEETQGQIFVEFNWFEFRVFLFLDWLPNLGWRPQSALLFTHNWKEDIWIHTFPKGVSAMWNANSPVQDLNSCCHVHFQQWYQLHHNQQHECICCILVYMHACVHMWVQVNMSAIFLNDSKWLDTLYEYLMH